MHSMYCWNSTFVVIINRFLFPCLDWTQFTNVCKRCRIAHFIIILRLFNNNIRSALTQGEDEKYHNGTRQAWAQRVFYVILIAKIFSSYSKPFDTAFPTTCTPFTSQNQACNWRYTCYGNNKTFFLLWKFNYLRFKDENQMPYYGEQFSTQFENFAANRRRVRAARQFVERGFIHH